ncbi:acid phosphatase type 7-like [Oppia nitens]|uniref:acid phosphatase type 7-like n=1 Tax=Oppia nitens TaxID=1686743 RepID=UPI0023D9AF4A|nr:acid phosphatase type 7-like [Oppia nitens]
MNQLIILLLLVTLWTVVIGYVDQRPEQIHLSYGADATQMMVTWVTMHHITGHPRVEYGVEDLDMKAFGGTTRFVDGGQEKRHLYIHRVLITDLKPSHKYKYHCGSDDGWSLVYQFVTKTSGVDWSPRFAVFGDMGVTNARSLPFLEQDVRRGKFDAILHVGDMAYNLHTDNARVGDEFMRLIEPIAAYVPYQVCPGNHEQKYNFSNYDNRFSMIDKTNGHINNHYYSFDVGPAHIVSLSTEFYYYTKYGKNQIRQQYEWLEDDLRTANSPENRAHRPWIITMAHKPLYCMTNDKLCSEIGDTGASYQRRRLRKGIQLNGHTKYGLEKLFHLYGVDLQLYGHEHNYQRFFPVYNNVIYNGSQSNPYHNPGAPVVVVSGSAGCNEDNAKFRKHIPDWSAFRSTDYGYSRMTVHNKTHISMEQVSVEQHGKIIDKFVISKDTHNHQ